MLVLRREVKSLSLVGIDLRRTDFGAGKEMIAWINNEDSEEVIKVEEGYGHIRPLNPIIDIQGNFSKDDIEILRIDANIDWKISVIELDSIACSPQIASFDYFLEFIFITPRINHYESEHFQDPKDRILVVTTHHMLYPITEEMLHQDSSIEKTEVEATNVSGNHEIKGIEVFLRPNEEIGGKNGFISMVARNGLLEGFSNDQDSSSAAEFDTSITSLSDDTNRNHVDVKERRVKSLSLVGTDSRRSDLGAGKEMIA
ncbi:hypothetical protein ACH5RR_013195 [Cinchona calisaya]|uniref:Uncharacterized protein n=1 Tax=Cinchona calisaya TaxID=153742 RepID=A0ABD3A529_9GENT